MSEPHMVTADEAREALTEIMSVPPKRRGTGAEPRIELLETVIAQAARIDRTDNELTHVAAHSLAQGRKLRRHEITLGRVQKATDLLDQMAGDNGRLADSLSGEYAKGKHDAYAKAAEIIREALGDTDD